MTYLEAAEKVLRDARKPLRYDEIAKRAVASQLLSPHTESPAATMNTQLSGTIAREPDTGAFVRMSPAVYGLREWINDAETLEVRAKEGEDIRIAFLPEYDALRALMPVLIGMKRSTVTKMRAAIWDKTGTYGENVDWTEPNSWIPERLAGDDRETAQRIWTETNHLVNPRHMTGHWYLANGYELLIDGKDGRLEESARGLDFRTSVAGVAVRELDDHEGLTKLLSLIAERGPASIGELLQPWMAFAKRVSGIRAESTGRSFLYYRLRNLTARGMLTRSGLKHEVSPAGLAYLNGSVLSEPAAKSLPETSRLRELITAQRAAVRRALREHLSEIDPYAFEHVVKQLLQQMGYTDVEVTAQSGDKGVDVVARIAFGITELREVIQVKRQSSNIARPVLDGLRGSLHRFKAVQGTLITLGGFTKGTSEAAVEGGAAPIKLIDGDSLIELLIDNEIGVRSEPVSMLSLDLDALAVDVVEGIEDVPAE